MTDRNETPGPVERFFEGLTSRSWKTLEDVLDVEVERVGPFGDRATGRHRYLAFLEGTVPEEYSNDVARITYSADGRSAFARVTEHLRFGDVEYHLEETYSFEMSDTGMISRVEVFWQTPDLDPGGFGSAQSEDSYT